MNESIRYALIRLTQNQIWEKLRDSTNSLGNLCLHLAGAEYQRMASAIGGKPLIRQRSQEFLATGGLDAEQLLARLREVRTETKTVLKNLEPEDLTREIPVFFRQDDWNRMFSHLENYDPTPAYKPQPILQVILGVVSHYGYHTGQIVYLAKLLQESTENILKWRH